MEAWIWKKKSLFNLKTQQPDIGKNFLYPKGSYEAKYQYLIKKPENAGTKHFNDCRAYIEYSNDMDNIYENIEEYNQNKKRKISIAFVDMTTDILSNKEFNPIVTELFIGGKTFLLFLLHSVTFLCQKILG